MGKRVCSLLMAFVLSLSVMPITAFAEGTDAVMEQEVPGGNTTADDTTGEDVSGGDAVMEDAAVEAAQTLIDALPEEVTAENADGLQTQLVAIDEALAKLTGEQCAKLDMTRYEKICVALNGFAAVQAGEHTNHPVCGATCSHGGEHGAVAEWKAISDEAGLKAATAGSYYLDTDIMLKESWRPENDVVLCLNGHSITMDANGDVISVENKTFTLCDCKESGKITHSSTELSGRGVSVSYYATFHMYGGTITNNSCQSSGGGVNVSHGTFNMYDGMITENSSPDGGGIYVNGSNAEFYMYDGRISRNTATTEHGGGVCLYHGSFTMKGGSICQNTAKKGCGGGVCVAYGGSTFTMEGGCITDNTSDRGGGVYVDSDTNGKNTFHMNGGTITGNTATVSSGNQPGGGVYVPSTGIFTVSGAVQITGNKNNENVNNVDLYENTITITGALDENASIGVSTSAVAHLKDPLTVARGEDYAPTDADAARFTSDANYYPALDGGAVKLYTTRPLKHPICGAVCTHDDEHPVLIWEGIKELGDIAEAGNYYLMNSATRSTQGSWWCRENVNLCLNGYSITAAHDSDAIIVQGGHLTLTDCRENSSGIITHSGGNPGSGVKVESGSFTMYGGTICGNTSESAGGVNIWDNSSFTMYGGTITGNNITGDTGGGVYVASKGTFTVSGAAKIYDNWKNGKLQGNVYVQDSGTAGNVCLPDDAVITIGTGLIQGARIGVSKSLPTTAASDTKIAAGANKELAYKEIFQLDGVKDPYYSMIRDSNGNLSIHRHEHGWIYHLDTDDVTITARCRDAATCPVNGGDGGSVTIKAPAGNTLTYDGSEKPATLENNLLTGENDPYISYTIGSGPDNNLPGNSIPTNAGTYTASVTLTGADDKSVTAEVTYEIARATPVAANFTFTGPDTLPYDGNARTATVKTKSGITGMGTVTVKYYQGEQEVDKPVDAGSYAVRIRVADGANFHEASELTNPGWKFTIAANTSEPSVELTGDMTYTGEQITPEVIVKVGDTTLTEGKDYTIAYGDNKDAGPDAGTVTVTAKEEGNYAFREVVKNFTIAQAEPGLNFRESAVNKTYLDKDTPFTNTLTNKGDGEVTYTSSDRSVATVDNDGKVTIAGTGRTTITATATGTTNYKAAVAGYTLTVDKAKIHVTSAGVMSRTYDGSTKADVTQVYFADRQGNPLSGLKPGTDYTATGTFNSPNAGNRYAEVKVTLSEDCGKKYDLITDTCEAGAYIDAKSVGIGSVTAENREYKTNDTSVTISSVTFLDADGNPCTMLEEGRDYTVTGIMDNADSGADRDVTVTVTLSGDAKNNYYLLSGDTIHTKVTISKAGGDALPGDNFQQKFSDHAVKLLTPDYGLPAGEKWTYSISDTAVTGSATVEAVAMNAATGEITYKLTDGAVGDTIRWTVTMTNDNYEDFTKELVLTLMAKDDQAALVITGDTTVVYGQTLTLGTTGGSGTGKVTYHIDKANSTGEAALDAGGVLTPIKVGTVTVTAVRAGDADYNEATSKPFVITITKAAPTGEPKYTGITMAGRTLADTGLTLTGSTLKPADGKLEWIDDAGNVLSADTPVEADRTYKWRFTPADDNYTILTGEIRLYPVYSIINGADSSWTQNTDGTLAIRGNGEFSKFQSVKVDGNVIDASNYTVTEGSTIITLKADYLNTLSEGSHTFEIVWTDGSASTGFTVARNTSGNDTKDDDTNDDKDSNDNSNNGSSNTNNSDGANSNTANSSGNTAQNLTRSPDTGDASGIWLTLFAVSLAGLAVMLIRRKQTDHK